MLPKSLTKVWCFSGSNSHRVEVWLWQRRIWRTSITWMEKGPNWSSSDDLMTLQTRIQSMVDKNIKLVDVIQVMLVRQILPCQS